MSIEVTKKNELKTLRCDICGKIYYSDESKNKMVIGISHKEDDQSTDTYYEYICPECTSNVSELIANPQLLEKLRSDKSAAEYDSFKLQELIKELRDQICGLHVWMLNCNIKDFKYMCDSILEKYKSTKKSRDMLMTTAIILSFGFATPLVLKLFIG